MQRYLSDSEWKRALRLLGWMTCASRSLKWHEMQGAMSIFPYRGIVDFDGGQARKHVHDLCGALVTVSQGRVLLVHATAKWYVNGLFEPVIEMVNFTRGEKGAPSMDNWCRQS